MAQTAESCKVYAIGALNDVHQCAPKYWLTGAWLDWGPFYTQITQSVLDNTWKSGPYICDAKNGTVKLASFGSAVSPLLRREANDLMNEIKEEKRVVFQGPLKDSKGIVQLAKGQKADAHWLSQMNFFVPGIDGHLPKN